MRLNIYKIMKKCDCSIRPLLKEDMECKPIKPLKLTSTVIFETDTGTVYDKDGNFIGTGEMKDGLLVIAYKPKKKAIFKDEEL